MESAGKGRDIMGRDVLADGIRGKGTGHYGEGGVGEWNPHKREGTGSNPLKRGGGEDVFCRTRRDIYRKIH